MLGHNVSEEAGMLECRNGKVWTNDRPGLGVTVDERQLAFVEPPVTVAVVQESCRSQMPAASQPCTNS